MTALGPKSISKTLDIARESSRSIVPRTELVEEAKGDSGTGRNAVSTPPSPRRNALTAKWRSDPRPCQAALAPNPLSKGLNITRDSPRSVHLSEVPKVGFATGKNAPQPPGPPGGTLLPPSRGDERLGTSYHRDTKCFQHMNFPLRVREVEPTSPGEGSSDRTRQSETPPDTVSDSVSEATSWRY